MRNKAEILPVIIGPTASGKTNLAVNLAHACNGEIISADSRQVYREMNIGTGKDLEEYTVNNLLIPYHLIDICEPGEKYNINIYFKDFVRSLADIRSRTKLPILCGGSGLYVQTALEGNELSSVPVNNNLRQQLSKLEKIELQNHFDLIAPNLKEKLDKTSTKRMIRAIEIDYFLQSNPIPVLKKPNINPVLFGIDISRNERRNKISMRLKERLENGMIEEVQKLQQKISNEDIKYYGLEYLFVTEYLEKKYDFNELFRRLEIAIHQFSKRQMTWFRKMEKDGYTIHWINHLISLDQKLNFIREILEKRN
ncbi:MAG: tRNA (adenosine(37)-N6)-dimethylallyltransferase MiaA [Flavobacteriales bacterium]|nr:tRNA (adenosine(37)-N6)-dimethylallyltransferase MiaA [Flavobacteriales bacterium]